MSENSVFFLAVGIGIVAGLRALTAPAAVSWAARLGWLHRCPVERVASKTATLILTKKPFDFDATSLLRNVRLDNDRCGLFACDTGLALVACLITSLRAWDWRRIPGRLLLNSQRS